MPLKCFSKELKSVFVRENRKSARKINAAEALKKVKSDLKDGSGLQFMAVMLDP